MAKKRPVGRPTKPKREKYKTPQRQFGRIGSEDWQTIQDATAHSGIPFTRWALPVVLREARRLLNRPKKPQS